MATKKEIEIKLKSTLDGKGVEEAKQKIDSLNKSTDQLDKGSQKATKSIKNMGKGTLQAAYFFDDLQYGIKGILNNIPGLVIGFGGGAGLAGALSLATLAGAKLYEWLSSTEEKSVDLTKKLEEERASYADKLPYDGMSELFIEYTQLGKPDKYQRTKKDDVSDNERYDIYDTFYWYDKGYVVCCLNGNVRSVSKESTETMEENYSGYWIKEFDSKVINSDVFSKDGRLKEKNSTRSSSGSSHSSHSKPLYGYSHGDSNHSSDSYNVHDYDDPEDFYYDNEDDFDGIDDAETYFYDHND